MFKVQHRFSSVNSIYGARHFTEINFVDAVLKVFSQNIVTCGHLS